MTHWPGGTIFRINLETGFVQVNVTVRDPGQKVLWKKILAPGLHFRWPNDMMLEINGHQIIMNGTEERDAWYKTLPPEVPQNFEPYAQTQESPGELFVFIGTRLQAGKSAVASEPLTEEKIVDAMDIKALRTMAARMGLRVEKEIKDTVGVMRERVKTAMRMKRIAQSPRPK